MQTSDNVQMALMRHLIPKMKYDEIRISKTVENVCRIGNVHTLCNLILSMVVKMCEFMGLKTVRGQSLYFLETCRERREAVPRRGLG